MSSINRKRIKVCMEWDRPSHELMALAHQAILNHISHEHETLKMGHIAGDIQVNTPHRSPGERYRVEFRLFTHTHTGRARKTSWTHVLRFVSAMQNLIDALPDTLNASIETSFPPNNMPWVLNDGFRPMHPTRVWKRKGSLDVVYKAPKSLIVHNEVAQFSRMLSGNKETGTVVNVPITEFRMIGEPRAVRKYQRLLEWAAKQPTLDPRLLSSTANGSRVSAIHQHNLLVLIKDGDTWKPIPATGHVIHDKGYAPAILCGEGSEHYFDVELSYDQTSYN